MGQSRSEFRSGWGLARTWAAATELVRLWTGGRRLERRIRCRTPRAARADRPARSARRGGLAASDEHAAGGRRDDPEPRRAGHAPKRAPSGPHAYLRGSAVTAPRSHPDRAKPPDQPERILLTAASRLRNGQLKLGVRGGMSAAHDRSHGGVHSSPLPSDGPGIGPTSPQPVAVWKARRGRRTGSHRAPSPAHSVARRHYHAGRNAPLAASPMCSNG